MTLFSHGERRLFRGYRIDEAIGAPFKAGHFAHPRYDIQSPMERFRAFGFERARLDDIVVRGSRVLLFEGSENELCHS